MFETYFCLKNNNAHVIEYKSINSPQWKKNRSLFSRFKFWCKYPSITQKSNTREEGTFRELLHLKEKSHFCYNEWIGKMINSIKLMYCMQLERKRFGLDKKKEPMNVVVGDIVLIRRSLSRCRTIMKWCCWTNLRIRGSFC